MVSKYLELGKVTFGKSAHKILEKYGCNSCTSIKHSANQYRRLVILWFRDGRT